MKEMRYHSVSVLGFHLPGQCSIIRTDDPLAGYIHLETVVRIAKMNNLQVVSSSYGVPAYDDRFIKPDSPEFLAAAKELEEETANV